ncbi:MAG TPA: peptidoglycan DD-metalloendopeptidase family protein [Candidatus Onthousia excrementipullorum]|uniref:Peptidoglycan DD-metalloendopeptidase family protein n=1 Tax=Candidatus Onthousia excrementipullorum TaxID=2840884 RepID=A0A9D1DVJ3_9FIRM|nr:peptidoglycan DD-metalloendopeptidase family protein [Candidatus Onthousia excrementipullorum]
MKRLSSVILIALLAVFLIPINTEAKTLSDLRKEVEEANADLENKNNQIAANDAEVAEIKKKIADIESQISEIESETGVLEQEIEESNNEIAEKSEQSKSLFQYLQVSEGENAYLEYIFGATDVTDMVYRMAIVEQLTEYNDKIMNELSQLVEENEQRKEELATKNKELEKLTDDLEAEQAKINAETAQIKDAMPSVEQQKKEGQKQIEYYENIGCGENENLNSCQKRYDAAHTSSGSSSIGGAGNIMPPSASGFYRPMVSGYVTQNWMNAGHLGIDLSNTNKTIEIYPIATGVVFAKYYDDYGALVLKIRHYVNGSYIYSTYAHLSAWYVNVGDIVTPDTVIGRMGNTGYSFGAHLHLELTTCDWHAGGGCTWSTYQRSTINPRQYIGLPSGLRVWWNGR